MTHVGPSPTASAPVRAPAGASFVEWSAVFAGAVLAAALSFVFLTFGTAIGLSFTSPWPNSGASAKFIAAVAILWIMIQQIGAFMAGGYVAGRLRSRWHETTEHEIEFRDGIARRPRMGGGAGDRRRHADGHGRRRRADRNRGGRQGRRGYRFKHQCYGRRARRHVAARQRGAGSNRSAGRCAGRDPCPAPFRRQYGRTARGDGPHHGQLARQRLHDAARPGVPCATRCSAHRRSPARSRETRHRGAEYGP